MSDSPLLHNETQALLLSKGFSGDSYSGQDQWSYSNDSVSPRRPASASSGYTPEIKVCRLSAHLPETKYRGCVDST